MSDAPVSSVIRRQMTCWARPILIVEPPREGPAPSGRETVTFVRRPAEAEAIRGTGRDERPAIAIRLSSRVGPIVMSEAPSESVSEASRELSVMASFCS